MHFLAFKIILFPSSHIDHITAQGTKSPQDSTSTTKWPCSTRNDKSVTAEKHGEQGTTVIERKKVNWMQKLEVEATNRYSFSGIFWMKLN